MDLEREARGPESELGHGTGLRSCNARIKMRVFPKIIQASCTQVGQRENPEVVPNSRLEDWQSNVNHSTTGRIFPPYAAMY